MDRLPAVFNAKGLGKRYDKLLDYEDVVIRAVDPDGIRIMHKGGVGNSVPIQTGNSGSPLVDSTGTVVGIVTATLRSGISERGLEIAQNVNYALKIHHAKNMLGSAFTLPAAKEIPKTREAMVKAVADSVALIKAQ